MYSTNFVHEFKEIGSSVSKYDQVCAHTVIATMLRYCLNNSDCKRQLITNFILTSEMRHMFLDSIKYSP